MIFFVYNEIKEVRCMRYILTKLKFINMLDFIGSRAQYCSLWGFYNPEKPSFKKKE